MERKKMHVRPSNKGVYNPPPPPDYSNYGGTQKNQSKSQRNGNPIFSDNFMDVIGLIAKYVGQGGVLILLTGLSLGAMGVDIGVGTLSLSLAFSFDIPYSGIVITSDTMAGALSWFTSGIQVFQRIRWIIKRGNVSKREEYLMYGIMGIDSILDMAGWGYLLTGLTPREFSLSGLNFFDWMIMLLGTGACLIAENLVVYLASMRTSGKGIREIFGKGGKK